jgi:hypothetical protein
MPVRVFISYAHDDAAHEERVRRFWLFLRGQGVDARLDLAVAGRRVDWAEWMTREVRDADRVLVIASPEYKRRAEGDVRPDEGRGVQWEVRLIRDVVYADQRAGLERVLPVVLPGCSADDLPLWLAPASVAHYVVSEFTVPGSEALLRLLTGQPFEIVPSLGVVPVLPPLDAAPPSAVPGGEHRITEQRRDSAAGQAEQAQRPGEPENPPAPATTPRQPGPEYTGNSTLPPVLSQTPRGAGRRSTRARLVVSAASAAIVVIGVLVATDIITSGTRSAGKAHNSPPASGSVTPTRSGGSSPPASQSASAPPGVVSELSIPLKPAGQVTIISLGSGPSAPDGLNDGSYGRAPRTGAPELNFSDRFKLDVSANAGNDRCSSELIQNSTFSPILSLHEGLLICVETAVGNALLEVTQAPGRSGTLHLRETYWPNASS